MKSTINNTIKDHLKMGCMVPLYGFCLILVVTGLFIYFLNACNRKESQEPEVIEYRVYIIDGERILVPTKYNY